MKIISDHIETESMNRRDLRAVYQLSLIHISWSENILPLTGRLPEFLLPAARARMSRSTRTWFSEESQYHPDEPVAAAPVSYTHLDVYKRQLQISSQQMNHCFPVAKSIQYSCHYSRTGAGSAGQRFSGKQWFICWEEIWRSSGTRMITAVSYTHLAQMVLSMIKL